MDTTDKNKVTLDEFIRLESETFCKTVENYAKNLELSDPLTYLLIVDEIEKRLRLFMRSCSYMRRHAMLDAVQSGVSQSSIARSLKLSRQRASDMVLKATDERVYNVVLPFEQMEELKDNDKLHSIIVSL